MKNQELFNKTIGILVKAYQNETLIHGNCYACAVGNLVADYQGYGFIPCVEKMVDYGIVWDIQKEGTYNPDIVAWMKIINKMPISEDEQKSISLIGYTNDEIALIECAFESADTLFDEDADGFNGLMSVVDTLMLIHEATETEASEAKLMFVKCA